MTRSSVKRTAAAATPAVTDRNGSDRTRAPSFEYQLLKDHRASRWLALDRRQRPAGPSVSMQRAFAANLIGGIGLGRRIERVPSGFAVEIAALPKLHRG